MTLREEYLLATNPLAENIIEAGCVDESFVVTPYILWLEHQITNIHCMINDLPENMPLYRDSGLWQVRSDDMEKVLYQQEPDETFLQYINRVYIGSL